MNPGGGPIGLTIPGGGPRIIIPGGGPIARGTPMPGGSGPRSIGLMIPGGGPILPTTWWFKLVGEVALDMLEEGTFGNWLLLAGDCEFIKISD
mgnify:CR=1 FL=1